MRSYTGSELPDGTHPSTLYAPDKLDVDQWVCVARDAGMKYAVLTTKHVAGHCLWPTKHNDYHVGTSGNKTDVVEAFVKACEKRGVLPGFYYCSWDNHNTFGSLTPSSPAAGPLQVSGLEDQFYQGHCRWNASRAARYAPGVFTPDSAHRMNSAGARPWRSSAAMRCMAGAEWLKKRL